MNCNKPGSNVCQKGGIKIHTSENDYRSDPFYMNPSSTASRVQIPPPKKDISLYKSMDLNIDNYSREDLYNLFGIVEIGLTDTIMKDAKKMVLKTHPDKSNLDQSYFLFFSKAYKRLFSIYEFQNKSVKKEINNNEYFKTENGELLNNMFSKNKDLKEPKNFNKWFNAQFDKHKLEDETQTTGYGEWLKSDEGVYDVGIVSKANMASEFEKQKKHIQSLTVYTGVNDIYASTIGGSLLAQQDNFTSSEGNYTDLRQAYVESIIPVTEDDYKKMPKFRNVEEYQKHRNTAETKPLDKEESMRQLFHQNKQAEQDSVALAFHYAKQAEKAKQNSNSFWSNLKQLTHF